MYKCRFLLPGFALVLLLVIGCGPSKVTATGKVTQGGTQMKLSDKGMFVIQFISEDKDKGGQTYSASTKTDGTFTVSGQDNKGIPTGKYKVAVEAMDPYGPGGGQDKLGGKYKAGTTTLTTEIVKGKEIVLEVGK